MTDKNTRVKQLVEMVLQKNKITRGSKSWKDYELSKKLVFVEIWADAADYECVINAISDYLGL